MPVKPIPDGVPRAQTVTTDAGTFTVGESVWVAGWPKSKAATYTLARVVVRDDTPDVHVWRVQRGRARMHSVEVGRLGKRRTRKVSQSETTITNNEGEQL